jgi:hypothetical protein
VHREELVVKLVVDDLVPRTSQLGPHDHGHHTGEQEESERGDEVELADHLVVGGRYPTQDHVARHTRDDPCLADLGRGHGLPPSSAACKPAI